MSKNLNDFEGLATFESDSIALRKKLVKLEKIAELYERLQSIQSALFEIASISSSTKELSAFFHDLHRIIDGIMCADNFYIALLDSEKAHISFVYFEDVCDPNDPSRESPVPRAKFEKSLTGYIFRTGKALLADAKTLQELHQRGEVELRGPRSSAWLGVPLKNHDDVIGAMVVQSYVDDITFGTSDMELLMFIAQHITVALLRKMAYEELENRVEMRTRELAASNRVLEREIGERKQAENLQSALLEISDITNSSENLERFYQSIHRVIGRLMNAHNFYIAAYDKGLDSLELAYFIDERDEKPPSGKLSKARDSSKPSLTWKVFESGNSVLLHEEDLKSLYAKAGFWGSLASSWLGVPLKLQGQTIGVLVVQSYSSDVVYAEKDLTILAYVSQHIAAALNRKRQQESLLEAHTELRIINDELEQRVERRTEEFSRANIALEKTLEERRVIEKRLAYDAFHDPLTGLANRALFIDRLEKRLAESLRESDGIFSVIYMDLDRFKIVNDSLGHLAGDALLCEASARISACIRPQDTLARLGGDEFSILLDSISSERAVTFIAQRILDTFLKPFNILEQEIYGSVSLGITLSTIGYRSTAELLRDADVAMYQSKAAGRSRYTVFDTSMRDQVVHRLKIENELRQAVQKKQIHAHFQPIMDLVSGAVVSFEALARWAHPELGIIGPDKFIPIAEETGVIRDIGEFMLATAAAQISVWQRADLGLEDVSVSVNVSPHQIEHQDISRDIDKILKSSGLAPRHLKLEVTESLLIHNFDTAKKLFLQLEEQGVELMLDDFGTGYSSLSYLHNFKFKTLKIDRAFVNLIDKESRHLGIIQTIVTLANLLKIGVVAEGIETQEQLDMLVNIGVTQGQGYHIGRPMSAKDVEIFLRHRKLATA